MRRFGNIRSASTDWRSFDDSAGCLSGSGGREGHIRLCESPPLPLQPAHVDIDGCWAPKVGDHCRLCRVCVSLSDHGMHAACDRSSINSEVALAPYASQIPANAFFFLPSHRKRKTNAMGVRRPSYWRLHFWPSKFFRTRSLAHYFVLAEALAGFTMAGGPNHDMISPGPTIYHDGAHEREQESFRW